MKKIPLPIIHMPLYGSMILTPGAEEGEGGTQHEENQLGSLAGTDNSAGSIADGSGLYFCPVSGRTGKRNILIF